MTKAPWKEEVLKNNGFSIVSDSARRRDDFKRIPGISKKWWNFFTDIKWSVEEEYDGKIAGFPVAIMHIVGDDVSLSYSNLMVCIGSPRNFSPAFRAYKKAILTTRILKVLPYRVSLADQDPVLGKQVAVFTDSIQKLAPTNDQIPNLIWPWLAAQPESLEMLFFGYTIYCVVPGGPLGVGIQRAIDVGKDIIKLMNFIGPEKEVSKSAQT